MRAGLRLALACLFLAQVASAQTWQFDYDASLGTKPSDQGWTHGLFDPFPDDGLSESNYVVALGVLAQGDTGGPNTDPANLQYYELSPPSFDFDTDLIVVDLRLNVLFSTLTPLGPIPRTTGFSVEVEDDGGEFVTLFVGSTELFLKGHGSGVGISLVIPFDSTLAYADYQLRVDRRGASVLVDGSVLVTLDREGFGSHVGAGKVTIGDLSETERSASQLQSFRLSRFNPPQAQVHNYEALTFTGGSNSSSTKAWTVACPAGKQALGGGVETIGADGSVGLTNSRPSGGPPATSWYGAARELVDTGDSWSIRVDAICGEISGYETVSPVPQAPHTTDAHQGAQVDCDDRGKVVIGGGGGFAGADLRQTLISSIAFFPFTEFELDWGVSVHDYGAAVSSSNWGVEIDAICTDALILEPDGIEVLDTASPKQAIFNCTSGKVPLSGGATIAGWVGAEPALRASRPKDDAEPLAPPVGWFASAQIDATQLWALEVGLTCAPIADPTVTKTGLISRWKGDDAGFDSWGFGHGTLENGVGFVPGILGQGSSFSFDGVSDQWVNIPSDICCGEFNSHDLYPEASFSVGAWIETAVVPTGEDALIVGLHDGGGLNPGGFNQSAWSLRLQPGGVPLAAYRDDVGGSSTLAGPGPDNLADGALHHVAMVRDLEAGQFRLYVDGLLEDEESIQTGIDDGPLAPGNVLSPDPVAIGIWRDGGTTALSRPFDGLIDDVQYYDRALSTEEIQNTAGCSFPLVPRVLNLDAALFGNPAGGDPGLCVFLEAGDYRATLVNPALDPSARLTAWSPSATATWSTAYVVEPEVDGSSAGGFAAGSATPQQAFDATTVKELDFTLSVDQRVHFSMVDDAVLDNRGGLSIKLENLPEPSFGTGVAAGTIVLGFLSRRRSGRVAARAGGPRR